jgi:hypothetical protein
MNHSGSQSQAASTAPKGIMVGCANRETFAVNPCTCRFSGIVRMADMAALTDLERLAFVQRFSR